MTLRTLLVVHLALVASALIATPSIVFARQFEGGKVPIAIADSVQTGLEVPTFVGTTVPSDNRLRMAQNSSPSDKAPAGGGEKKLSDGHSHEGDHSHAAEKPRTGASSKHDGHDHGSENEEVLKTKDDGHDHGHASSENEHTDAVKLSQAQMDEFGVETQPVTSGRLAISIERPAEVQFDSNRLAHVVPRVSGIASSVDVTEGDEVAAGKVLAVLESRELADAKAGYLAAKERYALTEDTFSREKALLDKKITSEKSFFAARTGFAEARIALRVAEQKLHALGVEKNRIKQLVSEPETTLTSYSMRAPINGVVIKRHLALGESVEKEREAFIIADVSKVWVDISIYPQDLQTVSVGLPVRFEFDSADGQFVSGEISYLAPNLSEQTRTAKARVVVHDSKMHLRPGMFVSAKIDVSSVEVPLRVPKSALQTFENKNVVFVFEGGAFEPRAVELGQSDNNFAEVTSGLKPNDIIVTQNAFLIKSQLSKESFGDGHNH